MATCRYSVLINIALKMSNEPYISYCTDDCIYMPERLKKAAEYLDIHPDVMVAYNTQRVISENGIVYNTQQVIDEDNKTITVRPADKIKNKASALVDHSSVTHRRVVLDTVGYWSESRRHWATADSNFWDRLSKHWDFYPIPYIGEINLLHKKTVGRQFCMGDYSFVNGIRE